MMRIFLLLLAMMSSSALAQGSRPLETLVDIQGVRNNQLVGYGLVVGLDGTGDRNQVEFTGRSVGNMLEQFGIQLDGDGRVKTKNVAAVMITAKMSVSTGVGQTIDRCFLIGRCRVTSRWYVADDATIRSRRHDLCASPRLSSSRWIIGNRFQWFLGDSEYANGRKHSRWRDCGTGDKRQPSGVRATFGDASQKPQFRHGHAGCPTNKRDLWCWYSTPFE